MHMQPHSHNAHFQKQVFLWVCRFATALLIFVLAFSLSLLLRTLVAPNPFLLFWPGVALAAWYGGFASGVFVSVLTLVTVNYYFQAPNYSLMFTLDNVVQWSIFIVMSIVISWLFESRRRAHSMLQKRMQEQRKLAEELSVSNQRFHMALQGTPISVFNQDMNLRYTWLYNPHGRFQMEMVQGKRDVEIMEDPKDAVVTERLKREVLQTGIGIRQEVTVHIEGIVRCYDLSIEPMRGIDGRIVGVTCASIDVTERKRIEEKEHEQRMLAEALRDSAIELNSTLDLEEVLDHILTYVGQVVPHDAADIMLFDAGKAHIVGTRGYRDTQPSTGSNVLLSVTDSQILQKMVETGEPLLLPNARIYPEWTEMFQSDPIRSYAGVPILRREKVIGFLNLTSTQPDFFTVDHAERLKAFAAHAALAISNAQSHEQARALGKLEERQRIARDLHDAISQKLFTASLMAEAVEVLGRQSFEQAYPHLETMRQLNRSALSEMRLLLMELRPELATSTRLDERLLQLVETVKASIPVVTDFSVDPECAVPAEVKETLYRIAQEAVNNVVRHSEAAALTVRLNVQQEYVAIEIEDDGIGFNPKVKTGGLGKQSMRERAESIGAQLGITSRPGEGTQVKVLWQQTEPEGVRT